ncbi:LuxR C-terminal-related transcriptional regulator [Mycetocola saprophilus]|uniref:LuxR C-terminal-related transcriptional regulator n=1 Tax=Mycetocola saprophilus TaxID=76636 RepID=UPI003BF06E15
MRTLSPPRLQFDWTPQAAEVLTSFSDPSQPRALALLGPTGCGKTAISSLVIAELGEPYSVLRIRGVSFGSDSPYLAIAHLVSGTVSPADTPVSVLRRLDERLRQISLDRPVLLYIQNFELLDSASAAVLSTLLGAGEFSALITCGPVETQASLMGVIAGGMVEPVEIRPLSIRTVHRILEEALPGTVPYPIAERLTRAAAGNPVRLRVLVEQALAVEGLQFRDGVWSLSGDAALGESGSRTDTAFLGVYELLGEHERFAINALAVFERLSIAGLMDIAAHANLEQLERAGLIIIEGEPPRYRLASSTVNASFLRSLSPDLVRDLWRQYGQRVRALEDTLHPAAILRATRGGVRVTRDELYAAAFTATGDQRPDLSDLLLDQLGPDTAETFLIRAGNARQRGNIQASEEFATRAALVATVSAEAAQARALHILNALEDRAQVAQSEQLLEAFTRWQREHASTDAVALSLVVYCDMLIASHRGRWQRVREIAEEKRFSRLTPAMTNVCLMLVAEALCVQGLQNEGIALARRVFPDTLNLVWFELRDTSVMAMWRVLQVRGEWDECRHLAAVLRERFPQAGSTYAAVGELVDGFLALLQGRTERAERPMRTARALFAQLDPAEGAELGRAMEPLLADPTALPSTDIEFDLQGVPRPLVFLGETIMTRAHAEGLDLPAGILTLVAQADAHHLRAEFGYEVFPAAGLIRLLLGADPGTLASATESVQRARTVISRALSHSSGPLARACAAFEIGLDRPDVSAAVRAGNRLSDMLGLGAFVHVGAGEAVGATSETTVPENEPEGLSERERHVFAALRDGLRNREIAAILGISPRTAEGHVQRLYRRLGVRSRTELLAAYPVEGRGVTSIDPGSATQPLAAVTQLRGRAG